MTASSRTSTSRASYVLAYPFPRTALPTCPFRGPIFGMLDGNEVAVRQRIRNLCDYLMSIQEKKSLF